MAPSKSVLLTGCSEGGIGYALCEEFARCGCRVYATARNVERMRGLEKFGVTLLPLDTTKQDSIDAAAKQVLALEPSGPDILINNAGVGMRGALLDCDVDEIRRLFDVNLLGNVALVQAVGRAMVRRGSGTVINVGSSAGFWGWPFLGAYAASKAALKALSDCLRLELKPFGINVVHAAPGFVRTGIYENTVHGERIFVDKDGPYGPMADKLTECLFKFGAMELEPFARRFVTMALSNRPPALYLDGRWALPIFLVGQYLPTFLHDFLIYRMSGVWKLAPTDRTAPAPLAGQDALKRSAATGRPLVIAKAE